MPVVNDLSLAIHAKAGMVNPFSSEHIGPCSIDLTLADHILIESLDDQGGPWAEVDINKPYLLAPKQFCLASTHEVITIPEDMCGQIILRSSAARAGLNHALAGFLDPGFSGQVTLELTNQLQLASFKLHAGQRLVQLILHTLNAPTGAPYALRGNYQNQRRVTASNNNFAPIPNAC